MIVLAGYTVYNWAVLSHAEGWGVVAMAGLFLVCLTGIFVDFILQLFVKNRWLLNGLEVIVLLVFLSFIKIFDLSTTP